MDKNKKTNWNWNCYLGYVGSCHANLRRKEKRLGDRDMNEVRLECKDKRETRETKNMVLCVRYIDRRYWRAESVTEHGRHR